MTTQVVVKPQSARDSSEDHWQADESTYSPRILILTAEIGAGHLSTAKALCAQLKGEDRSVHVEIEEPLKLAGGLARLPKLYRFMTAYLPTIWALFYNSRKHKIVRHVYGRFIRRRLRPAFAQLDFARYDTVVLTYSMYCNCISILRNHDLRIVVLVTDLFGGPYEWFLHGADQYIVPTKKMKQIAEACSIAPERISVLRLPTVVPDYEGVRPWTAKGRDALNILVIGGSEGLGPLKEAASGILQSKRPASVTVLCGHNKRLYKRLHDLRVVTQQFVERAALRYPEYDFVVTKPGSVTVMELLQLGIPFVMLPGIPGIEDGNTKRLRTAKMPNIVNRKSAASVVGNLVNDDLSLSKEGLAWKTTLDEMREDLPAEGITIEVLAPAYQHAKIGA